MTTNYRKVGIHQVSKIHLGIILTKATTKHMKDIKRKSEITTMTTTGIVTATMIGTTMMIGIAMIRIGILIGNCVNKQF